MRLSAKLLLGFGSVWMVLLVTTILAMHVLRQHGGSLETAFQSHFESVVSCDRMKTSLDEINREVLASIWSGTVPSRERLDQSLADFSQAQDVQRRNITLPGENELTMTFFQLARDYQSSVNQLSSTPRDERAGLYRKTLLPQYLAVRSAAQDVINLNSKSLVAVESNLRGNIEQFRLLQTIFVVIGAALAIVFAVAISRRILGPLQVLTVSARQIEAGNLDLNIAVHSKDELGELGHAFNAMAARLRDYRRLDHARLLRTQQTTQLAIDSLPDAVAVFDPEGVVEISNEQARAHFGLHPGSRQSDAHLEWLSHLFVEALATKKPIDPVGYESAIQLFDRNQERFLLPRAVPMMSESDRAIGVVLILVDVTRLYRAHELRSGLLATVSHELKTPLAATRFSVHLLAQEGANANPLTEYQRKVVKAACEGADRLNQVIENLLQFHRVEEGQYQPHEIAMLPCALVGQVVESLSREFMDAGLELVTDVPGDLPPVRVDPDLIGYVLSNLLTNALKFVPRGGRVSISATPAMDFVKFVVSDNGPGIEEKHLSNLFRRFYRAGAPRSVPGAGLGLAIARQLVEAHGGRISASRADGGGMEFSFTLKADRGHADV